MILTNILARSKVRDLVLQNVSYYYPYVVSDDDRPDIIAHKYYGSTDHTWLVLLANDILDPFYDWPLSQEVFEADLVDRYDDVRINNLTKYHMTYVSNPLTEVDGSTHTTLEFVQTALSEIRNTKGQIIDLATYQANPAAGTELLSIYDVESEKNEAKREIKIIDKQFLSQIIRELKQLFQ